MSDFDKTNELDSYGVWVKKPPKTIDSSENTEESLNDTFDIDTDLPDFSELDIENTNTNEDIISNSNNEEEIDFDNMEDISLDEFIEGGVFESEEDSATSTQEEAEPVVESTDSEEDDNINFDDLPIEENTSVIEDTTEISSVELSTDDDQPFDIDLSFEDEDQPATPSQTFETVTETSSEIDSFETESVDLSEFGIDDLDSLSETTESEVQEASSSDTDMEDVDLSEFGFDADLDDTQDDSTSSTENVIEEPPVQENEVESLDVNMSDEDEIPEIGDEQEPVDTLDTISEESLDIENFDTDAIIDNQDFADIPDFISNPIEISEELEEENIDNIVDTFETNGSDIDLSTTTIEDNSSLDDTFDTEEDIQNFEESLISNDETIDNSLEPDSELTENTIIDSFDEETSTLIDDSDSLQNAENTDSSVVEFAESIRAPILDNQIEQEEQPSPQMTAIFSQIVEELSSLKNEIASLKNDFATLKNNDANPIQKPQTSEGFFNSTDEDETIALSTDELDNILNNASFSEAIENGEQEEVENAQETSSLDDTSDEIEPPEELPTDELLGAINETVDVPDEEYDESNLDMDFSDDTLEEPSLEDVNYNIEDEETQAQDELPEEISIPKTDDIIVESSTTDLMDSVETEKIQVDAEQESLDDYLGRDPSIDDTLTAEKIDYLSETPINEVEVEESNQSNIPDDLKSEIKSVLSYMDQLLENLPEDKIAEFAQSEQFDTYKKLFKELGLA